jgi:hypothetical protein
MKDQFACFSSHRVDGARSKLNLKRFFMLKVVRYSLVTKYLRSAPFGERDAIEEDSNETADADLVDQAILQA